MSSKDFQFWTLGGSGEVGMNSLILKLGETLLPIDAGVLFADSNDFGIESLHADYEAFFREHRPNQWLITHAHEDHIGAVAALLDAAVRTGVKVPTIYAPTFACELIRDKVLDDVRYKRARKMLDVLSPIEPGLELKLEEGIKVRFLEGRHSTLQCCSLAIEWKSEDEIVTRILHTSDFKIDENIYADGVKGLSVYADAFKGAEVDFLLIDSTNAERDGHTVSESDVLPNLKKLIEKQEHRVFVSMFSSNVYRMASLMSEASSVGRAVCLAGRSFNTVHRVSQDKGLYNRYCPPMQGAEVLSSEDISRKERHQQLIICSGSQGEHRSVLNRLSGGKHPDFSIEEGDAVILSSKTIPGNEKSISRMINGLLRQGARVYWGDYAKLQAGGPIHGSGHARRDEIRAVMNVVKARHIIPVHGELRQLKACAELAEEESKKWKHSCDVHVVENLTQLKFEYSDRDQKWNFISSEALAYQGRILRFANFTAHSLDGFLKVRKKSALGGMVSICLDSMGRVKLHVAGVLPTSSKEAAQNIQSFEQSLTKWCEGQYQSLQREGVFTLNDKKLYEDQLAEDAARYIRRLVGVRPYVVCHLLGL